jgi:hypothetical protein
MTSLFVLHQFNISILPAIVGSLQFVFLPCHFLEDRDTFFGGLLLNSTDDYGYRMGLHGRFFLLW